MEKIKGEVVDIKFLEKEIDKSIDAFKSDHDIDDFRKASQNEWTGCMMYIYRSLFRNTDILYNKNSSMYNNGTYRQYNYTLLNKLCEYYIYLCNSNYKVININGFSKLTGINVDTIYSWGTGASRQACATAEATEIFKKLQLNSETSASDKVVSGDGNKIGVIAYLNHYHSWNLPGVSREVKHVSTLTASDLPKLSPVAPAGLPDGSEDSVK